MAMGPTKYSARSSMSVSCEARRNNVFFTTLYSAELLLSERRSCVICSTFKPVKSVKIADLASLNFSCKFATAASFSFRCNLPSSLIFIAALRLHEIPDREGIDLDARAHRCRDGKPFYIGPLAGGRFCPEYRVQQGEGIFPQFL